MNNLQGGITSSQLTPQAYTNSSQKAEYQDTISGSEIQQSSSANYSVNSLQSSSELRVVDNSTSKVVLGTSTVAKSSSDDVASKVSNTNYVPVGLLLFTVSAVAAFYFIKKYKKLSAPENE